MGRVSIYNRKTQNRNVKKNGNMLRSERWQNGQLLPMRIVSGVLLGLAR
jgi:hypothetical protein